MLEDCDIFRQQKKESQVFIAFLLEGFASAITRKSSLYYSDRQVVFFRKAFRIVPGTGLFLFPHRI